ncbi:MAG: winged helix-turn-helix transcriptional regulator [Acidimicrobiales bacterium]
MPKKAPYGQYCPVARALDLVGDRWTLLIVRELSIGPLRYGALSKALPISTDVLAGRLRDLRSHGIVRSVEHGYELTDDGRSLAPVLRELGRWGARHLGAPPGTDQLRASHAVQMLVVAHAGNPQPVEAAVVVRSGELECTLVAGADGLIARRGASPEVDAVVETDPATLWAVGSGRLAWDDAVCSGELHVAGDSEAARRLLAARLPQALLRSVGG